MVLALRKALPCANPYCCWAIWGVWHWPYLFMGYDYGLNYWGAPVVGPLLFVAITYFLSTFLIWVTLRSGSVWPVCLAYAVNNSLAMLMAAFGSGEPDHLIGPACAGIIGSLGYAVLAR
jgi:membrane protease YdiL (CAAX protease family)